MLSNKNPSTNGDMPNTSSANQEPSPLLIGPNVENETSLKRRNHPAYIL